ncbi:MAG: glycine/betaine/sarcosine/D-proline family reductase selenoprotein B [Pyrinomonadaceae bacterium]|nr:glycine/betaine/sarcosine/D-proline family reductase selenoprotein B [Pyrinomonadaceae bacterium]MDW8303939.1 glycine/sarcosine/betaine reductase selenoprotein B family protein [Acidobacteriota bacterium]
MLETIKQVVGLKREEEKPFENEVIENLESWTVRFSRWRFNEELRGYPFVENRYAPFRPARRALPMLNLGLISSAGAYIDGTKPFDTATVDGDVSFREIPREVEAKDLAYSARGYDPKAVTEDRNAQIPIERLIEYEENAVIGRLNEVWWSLCGFIPNARLVAEQLAPKIAERLHRYNVQAALLIPASRLCHQTVAIIARKIEQSGIPTMTISVDREITEKIRPPRAAYYEGEFGSVAGKPNWKEYQLRILDESLRLIEPLDQPSIRKLVVELETEVEKERGEK